MKENIYNFEVKKTNGELVSLKKYEDKVILIVNTATKCGLAGQFDSLEKLYQKYKDKNFIILAFPCGQFANQEPDSSEKVETTCKLNFGVTFPIFSKIDVNGENEEPLYTFLKSEKGGFFNSKIKWNFTKFLINKSGEVVSRFAPTTKPEKLEKYIEKLLD